MGPNWASKRRPCRSASSAGASASISRPVRVASGNESRRGLWWRVHERALSLGRGEAFAPALMRLAARFECRVASLKRSCSADHCIGTAKWHIAEARSIVGLEPEMLPSCRSLKKDIISLARRRQTGMHLATPKDTDPGWCLAVFGVLHRKYRWVKGMGAKVLPLVMSECTEVYTRPLAGSPANIKPRRLLQVRPPLRHPLRSALPGR